MKIGIIFLAALLSTGCVSATVTEDSVCSSKLITFPSVPVNVPGEHTVSDSTDENISDALGKITKHADLSLTSVQLMLTGNTQFINHLKVVLHSDALGDLTIADGPFLSSDGNVPVTADQEKMLAFLEHGTVTMTVYATGKVPAENVAVTSNLCIGVSAHASKSVSDL